MSKGEDLFQIVGRKLFWELPFIGVITPMKSSSPWLTILLRRHMSKGGDVSQIIGRYLCWELPLIGVVTCALRKSPLPPGFASTPYKTQYPGFKSKEYLRLMEASCTGGTSPLPFDRLITHPLMINPLTPGLPPTSQNIQLSRVGIYLRLLEVSFAEKQLALSLNKVW